MRLNTCLWIFAVLLGLFSLPTHADTDPRMAERVLGKADAPVKVEEFVALTCSHCADFYTNILPDLEKKYVDTGKARFILRDFPIDGVSLKASAVARCMPADEYFPFVSTLFKTQMQWAFGGGNPETNLIQYAKLGGLPEDKAKACLADTKLQDAIIAERSMGEKYKVEATPTFVINDGAEIIQGAQSVEAFSTVIDRQLAGKK